jgi:hypothetical protein
MMTTEENDFTPHEVVPARASPPPKPKKEYKNPFLASLDRILTKAKNKQRGYNKKTPIYETFMMVFMPGEKITFVERWCTATFISFEYYTRKKSRVDNRKPLFKIDLYDIETVKRAEIADNAKGNDPPNYYFEIVLREDCGYNPFEKQHDKFSSIDNQAIGSVMSNQSSASRQKSKFHSQSNS